MARSSLKTRGANLLARWPRCWNGTSAARPYSTSTDPAPPGSWHPWPGSESPGGLHGANHGPGLRGSARPIVSSIKSSYPKEAEDMRRIRTRSWLLGAVAAAALAATGGGSAASAKTVNGTVGPGFTIGLTMQGKKVTKLNRWNDVPLCHQRPRGHARLPPERARLQSRSHERGVHRDEELRAEAEEGELPLRLRPALRVHARQLQGLLSCDHRGSGAGLAPPISVAHSLF